MNERFDAIHSLPLLPGPVLSRQESSHHRSGVNHDHGNFLYIDDSGEAVLLDARGPGCVNSIFATGVPEDGVIRFYFDDEPEPRYSLPTRQFFQGRHPDFPAPLASYRKLGYFLGEDSMGGNLLMKIPFEKALRIAATGGRDFYYHILWEQYPSGAAVPAFPDRQSLRDAAALWQPPIPADIRALEGIAPLRLDPGRRATVLERREPGCVVSLMIEGGCLERLLDDVFLCIRWDDQLYESVHAPLGHFFAIPAGIMEMNTPLLTVKQLEGGRVRLICRWPMPFWMAATVELLNKGSIPIANVLAVARVEANPHPAADAGYFTAQFRQGRTVYGEDWPLLRAHGRGRYVGTVHKLLGEHYCEGDEHFTLDGACTPQINGTGTEDYYLFCFWSNPALCLPHNGCTSDVYEKGGGLYDNSYCFPSAYYRFHLDGPIAFHSSIDAAIQHGDMNEIHSNYSSLAFCYLRREPHLALTDCLDPANARSRAAHGYRDGGAEEVVLEASFIGQHVDVRERRTGREHDSGDIEFELAVDPDNRGVLLRRRIDQGRGRQMAEVFVDGEAAGLWYDANRNDVHRWHDSDFLLPPALTAGKSALRVTLRVVPHEGGRFSAYGYSAHSFVQPAEPLYPARQAIIQKLIEQGVDL